jgi:hypothetical protein
MDSDPLAETVTVSEWLAVLDTLAAGESELVPVEVSEEE